MFKKIFFSFLFFLLFFSPAFFSVTKCRAQDALSGLETTANEVTAFRSQNPGENFISTAAGKIIGTVLSFVGVLFLILMIIAGITWMTAAGNDQQTKKAKDLLVSSIIGIVIVFAAYAITAFVGDFVSNSLSGQ